MRIDLTDQTILVTGASRGIGAEIARQLHGAGAHVALHYGRSEDEARALADELGDGRVTLFRADLADATEADSLFEAVVGELGPVAALVNNAGVAFESDIDDPTEDWVRAWDLTHDVNLRASGILCRAAIQHWLGGNGSGPGKSGGRIINIASRAAFRGDTKDYLAYAASKGGMVSLTRSIARAWGKQGIVAFTIAPGWVMTDMAKQFIAQNGDEVVLNELALAELTQPKDVAPTVVFLASGLSDHATGCTIDINAGSYVH